MTKRTKKQKKILMPDDCLGRHEILDRTYLLADAFEQHVYDHTELKKNEKKLANSIVESLWSLYQMIGANSAEAEGLMVAPQKFREQFEKDIKASLKEVKAGRGTPYKFGPPLTKKSRGREIDKGLKARSAWPGAGICGAQYDSFEKKK